MSFSIYAWSEPRTTPYAPALRQHLSLVTLRQTAWGHIASPLSHCSVHVLRAPARPSAFHAASTMKTASGGLGAAKGLVEMPLASSMPQKHDADVHSQACLQEQHADGWDESKHAAPQTPLILLLAASGRKEGTVCQAQVSPASPQPGSLLFRLPRCESAAAVRLTLLTDTVTAFPHFEVSYCVCIIYILAAGGSTHSNLCVSDAALGHALSP
ncbi:hypothetical protein ABBQ38_003789 [Trebouxia sp. C0009 RCD-2024]